MTKTATQNTLPTNSGIPAQLFAAVISSSDDAIVTKSLDGMIWSWNQGAIRLYGYAPDEAIGQPMTMLVPPDRHGEIADILAKVKNGERIAHYETVRQRKDGTTFPVSVSVSPVNDEHGKPTGAATIARDLTERNHARETELLARRNQDIITYSISHDLRTPLRALSGYSELLMEEYGDVLAEEGRGYAERITAASQQMSGLIDALLETSRIARATIHLQTLDLSDEVERIAGELQREEPLRRARFDIQRPVRVRADPVLIRIVLKALVHNAWRFTSRQDDAVIEFGSTPVGDAPVCCYVRDNGAGFDPAYTSKLFQPFQRLHAAGEFPGTGIGISLASVKQIVEHHRGRVWGEGKVGEGAAFYFTLNAEETARPDRAGGAAGTAGPATVPLSS